jgi:hypothetical protein
MIPVCEPAPGAAPSPTRFSPRAQIVLAGCACAGAGAFLYLVDPSRHAVYPSCILYRTTGIYCAGCGATRALYALLHGDLLRALRDNALFIGALPFVAACLGLYVWQAWQLNAWPQKTVPPRALFRRGTLFFLALILFTVLRNLPGAPFEWLRPA